MILRRDRAEAYFVVLYDMHSNFFPYMYFRVVWKEKENQKMVHICILYIYFGVERIFLAYDSCVGRSTVHSM